MQQTGGCLCGALRYEVTAEPQRVTLCHCRFCQRATGGAYLVEPIFARDDFALNSGETTRYAHISSGSGKEVGVNFCATCGTKLYLDFERFPEALGLFGGTFDDPNWFDRTGPNTKHIFLSKAARDTVIPAGVDTFAEHAMTLEGALIEPIQFNKPKTIRR